MGSFFVGIVRSRTHPSPTRRDMWEVEMEMPLDKGGVGEIKHDQNIKRKNIKPDVIETRFRPSSFFRFMILVAFLSPWCF